MGWIIIVLWLGICAFALMFTIFLVKPLFSFTKSKEADDSIEIKREDCPELFAVIDDIVMQTGNKKPKHVYLSADVNACVFFNSSFWSIFFPIRKNLKIGLGLFEGLSVDELKSILAHEFGHFSQKSMKIGSSVYVINQVLYNMTYAQDFWDRLLDAWCSASYAPWAITGGLTRWFTNGIKRMNVSMYKFVERGYRKLSRQMEYDADNLSCRYIGSDVFISGICKTEVNSNHYDQFVELLNSLLHENKIVNNIFEASKIMTEVMPKEKGYSVDLLFDKPMTVPHEYYRAKSRISMEGVWDSHPEITARIKNAQDNFTQKPSGKAISAWTLIPQIIIQRVSDLFLSQVEDKGNYQLLSNDEFRNWVKTFISERLVDPKLRPFFDRRIISFNVNKEINETEVSCPFTEKNRELIEKFLIADKDWISLNKVNSGEYEVNHITYDGLVVTKKKLPKIISVHKQYYEDLLNQVAILDRMVFRYMLHKAKDDDTRQSIISGYHLLFYADYTLNTNLDNLLKARTEIYDKLSDIAQSAIRTEGDVEDLKDEMVSYVQYLQESIEELDMDAVGIASDQKFIQRLNDVLGLSKDAIRVEALEGDFINDMVLNIPQEICDIHQALIGMAKSHICKYAEPCDATTEEAEEQKIIEGDHLSVADYQVVKGDNDTLLSWILFILYSLILFALFALDIFDNPSNPSSTYTDSYIDETPYVGKWLSYWRETADDSTNFSMKDSLVLNQLGDMIRVVELVQTNGKVGDDVKEDLVSVFSYQGSWGARSIDGVIVISISSMTVNLDTAYIDYRNFTGNKEIDQRISQVKETKEYTEMVENYRNHMKARWEEQANAIRTNSLSDGSYVMLYNVQLTDAYDSFTYEDNENKYTFNRIDTIASPKTFDFNGKTYKVNGN